jgi:hypothetical protein
MSERQPAWGDREVARGLGLTVVLHAIAIVLLLILGSMPGLISFLALLLFLLLGVSQLIYMVPAILIARARARSGLARGLIIGASVTFGLSTACWLLRDPLNLYALFYRVVALFQRGIRF